MTVFESLILMLAFATFVLAILSHLENLAFAEPLGE